MDPSNNLVGGSVFSYVAENAVRLERLNGAVAGIEIELATVKARLAQQDDNFNGLQVQLKAEQHQLLRDGMVGTAELLDEKLSEIAQRLRCLEYEFSNLDAAKVSAQLQRVYADDISRRESDASDMLNTLKAVKEDVGDEYERVRVRVAALEAWRRGTGLKIERVLPWILFGGACVLIAHNSGLLK